MIPKTSEILAQLVYLWRIESEKEPIKPITMGDERDEDGQVVTSGLASQLMYPPVFIINALDLGTSEGVISYDVKTDEVKVLKELTTTHMGQEVQALANAIEDKIKFENAKERDLNLGVLQGWCMGIRPSAVQLALRQLLEQDVIYEYRLADPQDLDSTYEFYTLPENKDKKYGRKQFKKTTSKKTKKEKK